MGIQNSSMGDVALSPTSQGVSNISTAATSKVQPRVVGVSGFLCVRLLNPSLNREAAW